MILTFLENLLEQKPTFAALDKAYEAALKFGEFDPQSSRFVIFSDTHKADGRGNDDFLHNEMIYHYALGYYFENNYGLILNGDIEECWEADYPNIRQKYGKSVFQAERQFADKGKDYYIRIFGNHDYDWKEKEKVSHFLKPDFGDFDVHEAACLGDRIFIVHGHQGDPLDDPDRFKHASTAVRIWGVVQRGWVRVKMLLGYKRPRAANTSRIREKRDRFLYEWAKRNKLLLIAGHTHKAIFLSFTRTSLFQQKLEDLEAKRDADSGTSSIRVEAVVQQLAHNIEKSSDTPVQDTQGTVPCYFNSGCCLYDNGITGIELADSQIRLIKWEITDAYCESDENMVRDPDLGYYIVRRIYQSRDLAEVFREIESKN